jgi:hypothetical protein
MIQVLEIVRNGVHPVWPQQNSLHFLGIRQYLIKYVVVPIPFRVLYDSTSFQHVRFERSTDHVSAVRRDCVLKLRDLSKARAVIIVKRFGVTECFKNG